MIHLKKILILEDELTLLKILQTKLINNNFVVDITKSNKQALQLAYENSYDLLILNDISIVKQIRKDKNIPYICLASNNTSDDILNCYENGCDDCIRRPFDIKELICKINVIFKRNCENEYIKFDNIEINIKTNSLKINNKIVSSEKKCLEILHLFISNENLIISYDDIINKLYDEKIPTHTVLRVYISKINSILTYHKIQNIRAIGYKLIHI